MNPLSEVAHWVKRTLYNIYGPAELDEKHDPIKQMDRDHEREKAAEEDRPAETPEHDLDPKVAGEVQAEMERRSGNPTPQP